MTTQDHLATDGFPPDFEDEDKVIIKAVEPYTMTGTERTHALIRAVRYIVHCGIPGDFVECGVWKGGSVMAMALTLLQLNTQDRDLYLFDTFQGMTAPGDRDVDYRGQSARALIDQVRCIASKEEAVGVVTGTGYDPSRIHVIKGPVEETIPSQAPESISLLRLDTDWHDSTRHELVHLFPRVVPRGVIILDDYGHWQGARQAVDEYMAHNNIPVYLHRIDYTGRIAIKT